MTTILTGRKGNYIRIPEEQYQADIAAAEERGRASVVAAVATPTTAPAATRPKSPGPTKEQSEAMEKLKVLQKEKEAEAAAAQDPNVIATRLTEYVAAEAANGRRIGLAQAAAELKRI